jgi:DNA-binding NarL/FixJ family response regulator
MRCEGGDASRADAVIEPLRVLLADDHALFRRGLREVLEEGGTLRVIAQAGDGEEAVRLARDLGANGLDLVLMDLEMPKLNGIGATRRILAEVPGLRIVVLTASVQDTDLFMAVDNGVVGFLNKDMNPDALVRTLEDVCRAGGLAMTRITAAKALGHLQQQRISGPTMQPSPVAHLLTEREHEVLDLIAEGLQNREIAERLTLSERTVHVHLQNIFRKLDVRNRTEAVARYRGD